MPEHRQPPEQVKTLGRYAVGDTFFHNGVSGEVIKIGRKWVTIAWEDFIGQSWTKRHLPEWLDLMGLNCGDKPVGQVPTPWEPNR